MSIDQLSNGSLVNELVVQVLQSADGCSKCVQAEQVWKRLPKTIPFTVHSNAASKGSNGKKVKRKLKFLKIALVADSKGSIALLYDPSAIHKEALTIGGLVKVTGEVCAHKVRLKWFH